MIAADTSVMIAFFKGDTDKDIRLIQSLMTQRQLILPSPVLSELLSDPNLPADIEELIVMLPTLEILPDFWNRTGVLRAKILRQKKKVRLKARLADALIAQNCLDHQIPLITRDRDFRHFATLAGLQLVDLKQD